MSVKVSHECQYCVTVSVKVGVSVGVFACACPPGAQASITTKVPVSSYNTMMFG